MNERIKWLLMMLSVFYALLGICDAVDCKCFLVLTIKIFRQMKRDDVFCVVYVHFLHTLNGLYSSLANANKYNFCHKKIV